jgi:hypothetical protein
MDSSYIFGRKIRLFAKAFLVVQLQLVGLLVATSARAQTGNSSTLTGTVSDPSGGIVIGATVRIHNVVSGLDRTVTTDASGNFGFPNVPFNPYHLSVAAKSFALYAQDVDVRSSVPVNLQIQLTLAGSSTTVTVEAASDLLETESTAHTDVDRQLIERLPLESASSSLSSLVTLASPGIAADSNGLFHGLGDHAENSFSVDGQPITDQQSKVFSNQIPTDSVQSLEVIAGAPPAEYGGKTSVVINVTTRSGLGSTTPHGSVKAAYGSFGSGNLGFDVAYGGEKWGNFISVGALNTGRFLDPPELSVMHDKGNEENLFDRLDFRLSKADTIQLNFGYTRSWFQNPNTFDQQLHTCIAGYVCNASGVALDPVPGGGPLGQTDQRSQIKTFNIAPTWTRLIGSDVVITLGAFVRRDHYNYYPSRDPFADFSPGLQAQTIAQERLLTNAGLRSDVSYVKGVHNLKLGVTYQHTFLTEDDKLGTVDPAFLALFVPGGTTCLSPTGVPTAPPCTTLAPSDLTRGGSLFPFRGHTDIKELALYLQDTITKGSWSFNLGIRGDLYNGYVADRQPEPRLGAAYNVKRTSTVLRLSYARTMESPFNENLIIANTGCRNPVIAVIVPPPNIACNLGFIHPGLRNEFHAGLQQAFGKYLVVDAEYIWKYTHGGYDFGVVAATPIAFPIEWHNSKIPGYALRVSVPDLHGFTALVVMSSVAARFFNPQVAGIPFLPASNVFRIDHDERFNQTTHLQYQPWKRGPWFGFNWRYDSGLVGGAIPCSAPTATCSFSTSPFDAPGIGAGVIPGTTTPLPAGQVALVNNLTGLPVTADQEFQSGLTCNGVLVAASPTGPAVGTCPANALGSIYVKIPAPGTENDDHHPQRIAPRHLFDASIGDDNLFNKDRFKWSLRFTVINLMNKKALYNFFSTFSGTHYVSPRAYTAELGFHF